MINVTDTPAEIPTDNDVADQTASMIRVRATDDSLEDRFSIVETASNRHQRSSDVLRASRGPGVQLGAPDEQSASDDVGALSPDRVPCNSQATTNDPRCLVLWRAEAIHRASAEAGDATAPIQGEILLNDDAANDRMDLSTDQAQHTSEAGAKGSRSLVLWNAGNSNRSLVEHDEARSPGAAVSEQYGSSVALSVPVMVSGQDRDLLVDQIRRACIVSRTEHATKERDMRLADVTAWHTSKWLARYDRNFINDMMKIKLPNLNMKKVKHEAVPVVILLTGREIKPGMTKIDEKAMRSEISRYARLFGLLDMNYRDVLETTETPETISKTIEDMGGVAGYIKIYGARRPKPAKGSLERDATDTESARSQQRAIDLRIKRIENALAPVKPAGVVQPVDPRDILPDKEVVYLVNGEIFRIFREHEYPLLAHEEQLALPTTTGPDTLECFAELHAFGEVVPERQASSVQVHPDADRNAKTTEFWASNKMFMYRGNGKFLVCPSHQDAGVIVIGTPRASFPLPEFGALYWNTKNRRTVETRIRADLLRQDYKDDGVKRYSNGWQHTFGHIDGGAAINILWNLVSEFSSGRPDGGWLIIPADDRIELTARHVIQDPNDLRTHFRLSARSLKGTNRKATLAFAGNKLVVHLDQGSPLEIPVPGVAISSVKVKLWASDLFGALRTILSRPNVSELMFACDPDGVVVISLETILSSYRIYIPTLTGSGMKMTYNPTKFDKIRR